MEERRRPTVEDVLKKIKDEGDFDALRLKIIRVVKENAELRNSIINQVKQSDVINQYVSEDMKPRQLSDAIFQELGRKIMGQISDEIWKAIKSNDCIKEDIKITVESVFNKMLGGETQGGMKGANPSPVRENQFVGTEPNATTDTSIANPIIEANILSSNEMNEPPGFASIGHQTDNTTSLGLTEESFAKIEALPTAVGLSHLDGEADDEFDLPPGFD